MSAQYELPTFQGNPLLLPALSLPGDSIVTDLDETSELVLEGERRYRTIGSIPCLHLGRIVYDGCDEPTSAKKLAWSFDGGMLIGAAIVDLSAEAFALTTQTAFQRLFGRSESLCHPSFSRILWPSIVGISKAAEGVVLKNYPEFNGWEAKLANTCYPYEGEASIGLQESQRLGLFATLGLSAVGNYLQ